MLVLLVLPVFHILIANLVVISEVHISSGPVNGCSCSVLVGWWAILFPSHSPYGTLLCSAIFIKCTSHLLLYWCFRQYVASYK